MPIGKFDRSRLPNPLPTVAFCLPGNEFTDGFMMSWTKLLSEFVNAGWPFFVSNYRAADMDNCRNRVSLGGVVVTPGVKPFGGKPYDYMLWIDSDMMFSTQQIVTLIEADKPIIGGLYAMNLQGVTTAGFLKGDGNHRITTTWLDKTTNGEPFEVDYNGFGFMLVKQGVFEDLGYPWFKDRSVRFPDLDDVLVHASEDVNWCVGVKRELGLSVWAHPKVRLGHQKRVQMMLPDYEEESEAADE